MYTKVPSDSTATTNIDGAAMAKPSTSTLWMASREAKRSTLQGLITNRLRKAVSLKTGGIATAENFQGAESPFMRLAFYSLPQKAAQDRW